MNIRYGLKFCKRASKLLRDWNFYFSCDVGAAFRNCGVVFKECTDPELVRLWLAGSGFGFDNQFQERLNCGDAFVCLVNDTNEIVSFGWSTTRLNMPVSELGLVFNCPGATTLYDFYTPERFRRHGFYTCLLGNLVKKGSECWIYAHKGNIPSCRAIQRAGFIRQSSIKLLCSGKFSLFDTQGA